MSKRVKSLIVKELSGELRSAESCVVVGLEGLDVATTTEFRSDLRQKGVRVRVLKNRVATHAMKEVGWEGVGDMFSGMSAVAFGEGGAVAASKCLVDWERKLKDKLKIRGGWVEGRIVGVEDVRILATIPDRKTLLSMIAAAVAAPMSGIASVVGEMISGVARAVGAAAEKAEKGE
ncbi:MAG: 50S ribosomal protein L10 [Planctomycetes bacterium]|jgi:large subunit ribosomal protein L10|nr:50S ribosomal protein L10 [Planctomycetota bacterium]